MQKIEKIFHFMNNFYIPFINSLNASNNLQENKLYESHIQIIWHEFCQHQTFDSLQGQQIKINNSGQWNTQAGPDFYNAEITINGEIKQGKIEIHLTPEHWYKHGHHWNSQYEDIILHAVWENPRQLIIPDHVPIIELKPLMGKFLSKAQAYSDYPQAKKIPYDTIAHQFKELSDENVQLIFQAAGLKRILAKSYKLTKEIIAVGFEQTFYQNFMEAMGYKNNRQQFFQLSQIATIEKLQQFSNNHQREAFLWGCSNLLPQTLPNDEIHQQLKGFTENIWQTWWTQRTGEEPIIQWSRQAQRPTNSPQRRLAGACSFLEKFDYNINNLFEIVKEIILIQKNNQKSLLELLNSENLWQNFYNFIKKTKSPQKLLGKSRCDDLLINLFIPLIIATNNKKSFSKRQELMQSLLKISKLQENTKLNLASNLFFIPPKRSHYSINNAIEQQGVLQLFNDYQNFSGESQDFWSELNIALNP